MIMSEKHQGWHPNGSKNNTLKNESVIKDKKETGTETVMCDTQLHIKY